MILQLFNNNLMEILARRKGLDCAATDSFNQHFNCAIGKLEKLDNFAQNSNGIKIFALGIVVAGILLRCQENELVGFCLRTLKGPDGKGSANKKGDNHRGKNDNVA